MFGLEMLPYYGGHDNADTNGSIDDQQYFTTTDNEKVGRFVTEEDIDDIIDATHSLTLIGESPQFTVGDRVFIEKKNCNGMVHYVGVPKFTKNPKIFVGLELDEPNGNCNGTLAGCTYFSCEDKYGLYQVPKNVSLAQEEVNVDIDEVDQQNYDEPEPDEEEKEEELIEDYETPQEPEQQPEPEPVKQPEPEPEPVKQPEPEPEPVKQPEPEPEPVKPEYVAPPEEPEPVEQPPEPEPEPVKQPEPEPEPVYQPPPKKEEPKPEPVVYKAPVKQKNDDYKAPPQQQQQQEASYGGSLDEAPKLPPRKEVDDDGTEITYPTYMTNLCVKCRTHHKLKNYKTINYSSKKFQVDDMGVQNKLEELAKNNISQKGHFIIDGNKRFAYILVSKPHEWRGACRVNTDEIGQAQQLLNYIEQNTNNAVKDVARIQKFNWDKNFQGLVSAIRKANM